ncbi:MAG: EAL domain-containing response regulator [Nannocystaceae bacterium]|nr:EAL domain-containing response regulator [Nannocystaceae bacterium]
MVAEATPTSDTTKAAVVLVVDDDAAVRRAMSALVQAAGHEVIQAADGEAAIEVARERMLDVAFVDRTMPGIDGIAVLQHLNRIQPMCQRVLLTGSLDLDTALVAVNVGSAMRVLEKPITPAAVADVIKAAVSSRTRMFEALGDIRHVHRTDARLRVLALLSGPALRLALQPIVRPDGSVFAYEALLRSSDPEFNGPLAVLRAVEEHGLVGQLGQTVMMRARDVLDRLPSDIKLFVNLHPGELADPDGLTERLVMVQSHAQRVVFEITERSSLADAQGWERSVDTMLERGFAVAVDDLGSGYSSLSVLAALQPRFMKIDMSIVRDIDKTPRKQRLFDLLCRFADATETIVVAEGIETAAEAEIVRRCGAELLQGYHYAKPAMAHEVLDRLEAARAA